jgi:RNA polymerase sigma-70 factor (ECF subfamily)
MGRYCRGDAAAFHRLYALLAPRLLAYLFGLLRDKAAAEDILQVTFLKVHEARSTYVLGANPIPWMYTIAHRTCLDELRKRKRNRVQLTKEGTKPRAPIPPRRPARSPRCTSSPRTSARRCSSPRSMVAPPPRRR